MPLVSITKLSTPGNGGSDRELSHNPMHHAGRGPADRTRGECARGTQYHTGVPFAALPHDIAADPRLSPTDLRVLAALLYYARQDPTCYPSDASIAARVHRHPGTVRRCLKRLEDLGYIRREFVQATSANPTGRLIHLTCTEPDWPRPTLDTPERRCAPTPERRAHPPRAPMRRTPVRRALTDVRISEFEERNVTDFHSPPQTNPTEHSCCTQIPHTTPQVRPTAPKVASTPPTPAVAALGTDTHASAPTISPRPLKDEFKTLPGSSPDRVRTLAWRLAHHLQDVASIGFFIMCLGLVASGSVPVERVLAAFVAADRSRASARKPGAIWTTVWMGWQPPLRPSSINQPVYCASIQVPGPGAGNASPSPPGVPVPADVSGADHGPNRSRRGDQDAA